MRAPVPSSSWLKLTSLLLVAPTSRTGTCTRPKLIEPVQMALGIGSHSTIWPSGAEAESSGKVEIDGRASSRSRTSTRCSTPPPASARPTSSTTTAGSRPVMLPHLAGRPPTLVRAPDGAGGRPVLREELPAAPSGVGRAPAPGYEADRRHRGLRRRRPADARLAREPRRARAAHPPVDGCADLDAPRPRWCSTSIPGEPATIVDCCRVALDLRDTLDAARARVRREDVGRQGTAPLGAAQRLGGRDRPTSTEDVRARARPAARVARPASA